jgi:hypothetical protein
MLFGIVLAAAPRLEVFQELLLRNSLCGKHLLKTRGRFFERCPF